MNKIFLIGNPNVGKSVIFSRLTGVEVISSNYPGTTISFTRGYLKIKDELFEVIDLPGLYSLDSHDKAEEVALKVLGQVSDKDNIVLNVVDSTNLERNLFLTLQLIEEGFKVIVCLNMFDDAGHRGIEIDPEKLERLLDVPVIPTCAVTGWGIKVLIERLAAARSTWRQKSAPEERWQEIGRITGSAQKLHHRHHALREILEDITIRPAPGLLIACAVMYISFEFVRHVGEFLINNICDPFFSQVYRPLIEHLSRALGGKGFYHHLLIGALADGRIDFKQSLGILTTAPYVEFAMVLPYVMSFYFVLSILEDSGYLPRLALLLDNVLHRLGLHGFAIIPVLLGFGCNVPGILATRMLESRRERFIAATLISIGVPCIPLQAMIFGVVGAYGGAFVAGVYLVLASVTLMLGMILNRTIKGYSPELLLEIPPYRFVSLPMLLKKLYLRIRGFLFEAMPIVFVSVALINILMLYGTFDKIALFFAPVIKGLLGLPPRAVGALAVGFLRKDVAVGLLMPLHLNIKQLFIAATLLALSFPCVATFAVLLKELGFKDFIKSLIVMVAVGLCIGTLLNFVILNP